MPRALPSRRIPRHHLMLHKPPRQRDRSGPGPAPIRTSDLVLALCGVVLLGGLALAAALALASGAVAP